ncbi:MAG: tRNA (adenosine(37)-N6)-threonylcarbamoyltransferase complex ATPase subunit type 1 TsaE [Bacteroidota bacterium]|nr:tRNA (adenosine(37)-N6)-threonylcarbamoyltransferase complex ATPase subunit type 1 TsaE [Bacteroidota bacterium]
MLERTITSAGELPKLARELLKAFPERSVFLFIGQMGVGKTTLIKEMCNALGVMDSMSSPTYSIVNEYTGAIDIIYHFDLYRLKNTDECLDIGFEEYVNSGNYCFIEWPEVAMPLMPNRYVEVSMRAEGETRYLTAQLTGK